MTTSSPTMARAGGEGRGNAWEYLISMRNGAIQDRGAEYGETRVWYWIEGVVGTSVVGIVDCECGEVMETRLMKSISLAL